MRIYTVYELPGAPLDAGGVVFVREGFSWPAFFFSWIWALIHKLWLVTMGLFVVLAALAALFEALHIDPTAVSVMSVAVQFFFALQANDFWRWTLERQGYRFVALQSARNLQEAELAFFRSPPGQALIATGRARPMAKPASGPVWPKRDTHEDVLGLFPKADT
ncbi:MAG: DUF2628 domain-containing protein [Parvibaculum sp.]